MTYDGAHRRGVRAVLVVAALTAAALLAPASASALSEQADAGTWGAHGRVLAMVRLGNTMFIGGRFDRIQSPDGKTRIAADNLAAIDLTTGQPVPGFTGGVGLTTGKPQVDSLAVSTDGSRLLVGGKFNLVDGQPKSFFAALSPQTGAIDQTFNGATFSGAVHAILVGPSRIYVGGAFKKINAKSHPYLAALMPDGTLDTQWVSHPDNLVRALTPSSDWSTIFVGGLFENVDGAGRISVARVSAANGAPRSVDDPGRHDRSPADRLGLRGRRPGALRRVRPRAELHGGVPSRQRRQRRSAVAAEDTGQRRGAGDGVALGGVTRPAPRSASGGAGCLRRHEARC